MRKGFYPMQDCLSSVLSLGFAEKAGAAALLVVLALSLPPVAGWGAVTMETGDDSGKTVTIGGQNQEGPFGTQPGNNGASTIRTPPRSNSSDDPYPQDMGIIVAPEIYVGPDRLRPNPPYYPPGPRPGPRPYPPSPKPYPPGPHPGPKPYPPGPKPYPPGPEPGPHPGPKPYPPGPKPDPYQPGQYHPGFQPGSGLYPRQPGSQPGSGLQPGQPGLPPAPPVGYSPPSGRYDDGARDFSRDNPGGLRPESRQPSPSRR